ncbi:MAG: HAD family phosphatase [Spartobacteria bacterium]|nr:HAD family phosphatase [Spartobacteria bacterium]
MHMPFKALIFDCDGTIADSMPLHFTTWQQTAQKHGFEFSSEQFYAWAGVPTREIIRRLAEQQQAPIDIDAAAVDKDQFYHDALAGLQPIQPVADIIRSHHGRLPLAVASGSRRASVQATLRALDLLDYFDALVTAEDVVHPKPAPDVFLKAAEILGVPPADCCAYEDSDLGLEAIRAAGMTAVDVRQMPPSAT